MPTWNIPFQALLQATGLNRHSGIPPSILEGRGSGCRVSSQGGDKGHPGQSREAPPGGRAHGAAGSALEVAIKGTPVPSTASTTDDQRRFRSEFLVLVQE